MCNGHHISSFPESQGTTRLNFASGCSKDDPKMSRGLCSDSSWCWGLLWTVFIWSSWIIVRGTTADTPQHIKGGDYCMFQTFKAECGPNEVVQMEGALYGRMRLGDCVSSDLGFVGCSSNVLDIVDNRCSGKRTCAIKVPDEEVATRQMRQACLTDLTMYLEANYTCQKVLAIEQKQCRNCDHVKVTQPSGTIASVTTRESGCGSLKCPWLIEAPSGKRINISLINYGWSESAAGFGSSNCQAYATVKDVATTSVSPTRNICAQNRRHSHAYLSDTHAVELRVVTVEARSVPNTGATEPNEFLFQYHFVGCENVSPPAGGWVKRIGDVTTMGCNDTTTTWRLDCRDNSWQGDRRTCSGYGPDASIGSPGGANLPSGLSVVIIVAVAFVVGALILCIGVVMFRRRYVEQQLARAHTYAEAKIETPEQAKNSLYMPPMYSQDPRDVSRVAQTPRKQHQQQQQHNREDYTHIWERPLPNPSGTDSTVPCTCSTGSPYGSNAHAQQTPPEYESEYNTLGSSEPPASHSQSQSRRMVYGNNTMARKECEKISPDSDIDPRYFQLDPDTMSSGEL